VFLYDTPVARAPWLVYMYIYGMDRKRGSPVSSGECERFNTVKITLAVLPVPTPIIGNGQCQMVDARDKSGKMGRKQQSQQRGGWDTSVETCRWQE